MGGLRANLHRHSLAVLSLSSFVDSLLSLSQVLCQASICKHGPLVYGIVGLPHWHCRVCAVARTQLTGQVVRSPQPAFCPSPICTYYTVRSTAMSPRWDSAVTLLVSLLFPNHYRPRVSSKRLPRDVCHVAIRGIRGSAPPP